MRPNWILWVRGVGGKVTEGLHVGLPLFGDGGVCGKSFCGDPITLCEAFIAFLSEFFPRLGVDEFLEFGLEFLLGWFFNVRLEKVYIFPRLSETVLSRFDR